MDEWSGLDGRGDDCPRPSTKTTLLSTPSTVPPAKENLFPRRTSKVDPAVDLELRVHPPHPRHDVHTDRRGRGCQESYQVCGPPDSFDLADRERGWGKKIQTFRGLDMWIVPNGNGEGNSLATISGPLNRFRALARSLSRPFSERASQNRAEGLGRGRRLRQYSQRMEGISLRGETGRNVLLNSVRRSKS